MASLGVMHPKAATILVSVIVVGSFCPHHHDSVSSQRDHPTGKPRGGHKYVVAQVCTESSRKQCNDCLTSKRRIGKALHRAEHPEYGHLASRTEGNPTDISSDRRHEYSNGGQMSDSRTGKILRSRTCPDCGMHTTGGIQTEETAASKKKDDDRQPRSRSSGTRQSHDRPSRRGASEGGSKRRRRSVPKVAPAAAERSRDVSSASRGSSTGAKEKGTNIDPTHKVRGEKKSDGNARKKVREGKKRAYYGGKCHTEANDVQGDDRAPEKRYEAATTDQERNPNARPGTGPMNGLRRRTGSRNASNRRDRARRQSNNTLQSGGTTTYTSETTERQPCETGSPLEAFMVYKPRPQMPNGRRKSNLTQAEVTLATGRSD